MSLTREIKFVPSHETMDIRFYLKGEKGVIQFCITTGWNHQMTGFEEKVRSYAYDIGYHSPIPKYDDHKPMEKCKFYEKCYYDGSSMYAHELFDKLIDYGDEYIWWKMEEFYNHHFNSEEIR